MFPLLYAFVVEKVVPRGWLPENVIHFKLMYSMLCVCGMSDAIHIRLPEITRKHAVLFVELFGNTNAKMTAHHLFDLPDDMKRVGSALFWFATERKHKDVVDAAKNVSRHLERTARHSFL